MDNIHTANGNAEPGDKHVGVATVEGKSQNLHSDPRRSSPPSVVVETPKNVTATAETTTAPDRAEDQNNNNQRGSSPAHSAAGHASPSPSPPAPPSMPKVDVVCLFTLYTDKHHIPTVSLPIPLIFFACEMLNTRLASQIEQ